MTDYISKQAAIDAVTNHGKAVLESYPYDFITADIYAAAHRHIIDVLAALPSVQPEPYWRPIKTRPMDEEERQEWSEKLGYDIEYEEAVIYSNLPDDGEEVLICYKWGHVCIDTFRQEEYGCYFEGGGDMDGVVAWMPLPEPYKGEQE